MVGQTVVNSVPAAAFEGMLADGTRVRDIISRLAKDGIATPFIPFGKAVAFVPGDNDDQCNLPSAAAHVTASLLGVAIADTSLEQVEAVAWGHYAAEQPVPVMRKGRIFVIAEDAVTPASDVFIRHSTPGGSPPLASRGSFRSDADTANASQVPNGAMKFLTTAGAGELVLLEVNLS